MVRHSLIHRREFIRSAVLASGALVLHRSIDSALASSIGPFKLGAISDGFSAEFAEALQVMHGYGLSWVEVRELWGKYNTELTPDEIKRVKSLLDQYGFRCSVVDSALYKCTLPGTHPAGSEHDAYPYSGQMDLLKRAIERAHAWGTDKVRGFTFWRVADPASLCSRISDELAKAAEVAANAHVRLVIENEESCNGGTGRELAAILRRTPAQNLGYNWDVGNGYTHGEVSYPDGYNALDKSRIWHLHLKGMKCDAGLKHCQETLADEGNIDLAGQFRALRRDRYDGTMSLECEFEAPGMTHLQTTKRSLEGLLGILKKIES